MRKQWIPGPTFLLPAHSSAKKEGLGTRLIYGQIDSDLWVSTKHKACLQIRKWSSHVKARFRSYAYRMILMYKVAREPVTSSDPTALESRFPVLTQQP